MKAAGYEVVDLKRDSLAGLKLGQLPQGAYRPLTANEIDRLRRLAQDKGLKIDGGVREWLNRVLSEKHYASNGIKGSNPFSSAKIIFIVPPTKPCIYGAFVKS